MENILKILDETYNHTYVLNEYCKTHNYVEEIYCMTPLVEIISELNNKKDHS